VMWTSVAPAPSDRPGEQTTEVEFTSTRALDELANSALLANPLGAAAILRGIPNGIAPKKTVPPEDRATLHAPWNARALAWGSGISLDANLKLTLPPSMDWAAPAPREEKRPWVTYSSVWSRESDRVWAAKVHLSVPRGSWPSAQRKEGLLSLDQIFMQFYQPLVLSKKP